jgi:hypothetical protein
LGLFSKRKETKKAEDSLEILKDALFSRLLVAAEVLFTAS